MLSPRGTRSVDFTGGSITIETKLDPLDPDGVVLDVERPLGDVWPFDFESILSTVIITACVNTNAMDAEIWALMIGEDRLAQIKFKALGEEPLVLENGATTIMVRTFEIQFDGAQLGRVYITPDGRLVARRDEAANLYIELELPTD